MGDGSLSMAGGTMDASNILDIYPLNHYYFGSKEALPLKEEETLDHRIQRLKFNYNTHGIRTCVQAVFLVELFKHPHLLLLQVGHSMFKLPGGRLRPGESEIECLRRKLSSKLSMSEEDDSWEVSECLGMWWRPDFETLIYPFLPPDIKRPKIIGVHKTLSSEVARKLQIHCTDEHQANCCSIVPSSRKLQDIWANNSWSATTVIEVLLQQPDTV